MEQLAPDVMLLDVMLLFGQNMSEIESRTEDLK